MMNDEPNEERGGASASGGTPARETVLLVANYDSDVGYAWWLMESFWVALACHLAPAYRVILAYPSISTVPAAILSAPIEPLAIDFSARDWRTAVSSVLFARREQVKLVYFTDRPAISWWYPLLRAAGVNRIAIHDHTPGRRLAPVGLRRVIKWISSRTPFATADLLIGATEFVTKRHREVNLLPSARCVTATNGIPLRAPADPLDVHALFSIPRARKIVVTVGRASHVKGLDIIINAIALLVIRDGRQDIHLLHCGDGPDLAAFRRLATEEGVSDFVTFAGQQRDIPNILAGCDLAIHASHAEVGYSLAILEYMQAGLPVIVSDDPSVSSATEAGRTGELFTAGNPESAAGRISMLLDNPEHALTIGGAAKKCVRELYTLDRTHAELRRAIDRILQW